MAERLVVLSDMWGSRKGLWITSYLGYLQQYFDIVYYDSQQLADLDVVVHTQENICNAFLNGGQDTAVAHILRKESQPSHYLTFCAGGTIAWKAGLKGLPIKSLYAISPVNLHLEEEKPDCPVNLLYGEYQDEKPSPKWAEEMNVSMDVIPKFGNTLYSDEKIIQKVCLELLDKVLKKQYQY